MLRGFPGVAARFFLPCWRPTYRQPPPSGTLPSFLTSTCSIDPGLVQPRAGRATDAGRIIARAGTAVGVAIAAGGFTIVAAAPNLAGILVTAIAIGVGTGIATPLAFAPLAGATPPERMVQTMGAAEVGRELGDAGGPLLVGGIAAARPCRWGLGGLAVLLAAIAAVVLLARSSQSTSRH